MFDMTTCHLNYFRLWHNGTFFFFFLPYSMGKEWEWKEKGNGTMSQQWKKKKSDYFCLLHKCLLGWGNRCLLVCVNQWSIILFMAKNHQSQASGANLLRGRMIAMCTFLFVLYNVNMIISKLTFWDTVGFWMKV